MQLIHTFQLSDIAGSALNLAKRALGLSGRVRRILNLDPQSFEATLLRVDDELRKKNMNGALRILLNLTRRNEKISFAEMTTQAKKIVENNFRTGELQELLIKIVPDLPPDLL